MYNNSKDQSQFDRLDENFSNTSFTHSFIHIVIYPFNKYLNNYVPAIANYWMTENERWTEQTSS